MGFKHKKILGTHHSGMNLKTQGNQTPFGRFVWFPRKSLANQKDEWDREIKEEEEKKKKKLEIKEEESLRDDDSGIDYFPTWRERDEWEE